MQVKFYITVDIPDRWSEDETENLAWSEDTQELEECLLTECERFGSILDLDWETK